MEGENSVINQGNVLVRDGMIDAVWSSSSSVPLTADLTNVPVIETNGTIYPGLIDLHNHMHYNHIPLWDFRSSPLGFSEISRRWLHQSWSMGR